MKYASGLKSQTAIQARQEKILVPVVRDLRSNQIFKLVTVSELIHRENLTLARVVESAHKVAPHKAGGSGHDDHVIRFRRRESDCS